MARPLPVNMLIAGTGAVFLVSGLGGKSLADVLKGSFGKLEVNPNVGSEKGENSQEQASLTGTPPPFGASPTSFSSSTIAEPGGGIGRHGLAPSPGSALFLARKRELERHFHRKLTSKEESELRDLERKGEL